MFLVQPGPGTIVGSVDRKVEVTCSLLQGFGAQWEVVPPPYVRAYRTDMDTDGTLAALREHYGIEAAGLGSETSTLTIEFRERGHGNNGTVLSCVAQKGRVEFLGKAAKVIFRGTSAGIVSSASLWGHAQGR